MCAMVTGVPGSQKVTFFHVSKDWISRSKEVMSGFLMLGSSYILSGFQIMEHKIKFGGHLVFTIHKHDYSFHMVLS
jgi:hypothetical protein